MTIPRPQINSQPHTTWPCIVEEYYRMGEAGFLRADERVKLIQGRLVMNSSIRSCHAAWVDRPTLLLGPTLQGRAMVRVQNSPRLGPPWEPAPDLLLHYREAL